MSNTNVYIKSFAFDEVQQKVNNISFNLDLEENDFTLNDKTLITKEEADEYITDKWSDWINSNGDIWAYKAWNTFQSGNTYYRMVSEPYILLTRQFITAVPGLEDQKKVIALIGLNKNTSYTNAKTFLYNKSTQNMYWIGNRNIYDGSTLIGDRVIRLIIDGISRDIVITPNDSAVKVVRWQDY